MNLGLPAKKKEKVVEPPVEEKKIKKKKEKKSKSTSETETLTEKVLKPNLRSVNREGGTDYEVDYVEGSDGDGNEILAEPKSMYPPP